MSFEGVTIASKLTDCPHSMLTGGEDPLYVARRLIVVASEDVGMTDPQGLPLVG